MSDLGLKHPRLGEALMRLFPDDSRLSTPDCWEVRGDTLTLWPERLGSSPTLEEIEQTITSIELERSLFRDELAWCDQAEEALQASLGSAAALTLLKQVSLRLVRLYRKSLRGANP